MKKFTVTLASFAFVCALGIVFSASAESLSDCKTQAGQGRYDIESDCYAAYGPQSGKWSATDQSGLNVCLDTVGKQYSADVVECQGMYMVDAGRPPYENREAAASAAIRLAIGLFLIFGI